MVPTNKFTNQHLNLVLGGTKRSMANSNLQKPTTVTCSTNDGCNILWRQVKMETIGLAICVVDIHQMYGFFEQPDGSRIPNVVTGGEC